MFPPTYDPVGKGYYAIKGRVSKSQKDLSCSGRMSVNVSALLSSYQGRVDA